MIHIYEHEENENSSASRDAAQGYLSTYRDHLIEELREADADDKTRVRIHLWRAPLDRTVTETEESALRDLLSVHELDELESKKDVQARTRFLISRAFLRTILHNYVFEPPDKLVLARESSGKPYLPDHTSICFNVSHTDEQCFVAIIHARDIGVDAECHSRHVSNPQRLAQRWFVGEEQQWMNDFVPFSDESSILKAAFLRIWTMKESFVKATGQGIARSFKSFSVAPPTQIRKAKEWQGSSWCTFSFEARSAGHIIGITFSVVKQDKLPFNLSLHLCRVSPPHSME